MELLKSFKLQVVKFAFLNLKGSSITNQSNSL